MRRFYSLYLFLSILAEPQIENQAANNVNGIKKYRIFA